MKLHGQQRITTHEEVYSALRNRYGGHSAREVAWMLGVSDRTAQRYLNRLATQDWVKKIEIHSRAWIYRANPGFETTEWVD